MKITLLALLLSLLTVATPALAQTTDRPEHPKDTVFRLGVASMIVGHGADLFSTGKCLGAQNCVEIGVLKPLQGTTWAFGAVKMAGAALQIWIAEKIHGWNKWAGRITAFTIGGAMLALGVRNGREAGREAGKAGRP